MLKELRFGANQFLTTLAILAAVAAFHSSASAYDTCPLDVDWQYICETDASIIWLSDIEEDSLGNVIAGGGEGSRTLGDKWRVDKVNPRGDLLWSDTWFLGPEVTAFIVWNVEIEPDDEVVAAGASITSYLGVLRKYSPDGNILWTYTATTGIYPALAIQSGSTIYFATATPYGQIQTIHMLTHGGQLVWRKDISVGGSIADMEMTPSGDLVAVIASNPLKVIRFDPIGNIKWVWQGGSWLHFPSADIVVDSQHNCFYLAYDLNSNIQLLKFIDDPNANEGSPVWIAGYSGFAIYPAISFSMDVDSMGNLWVPCLLDYVGTILQFDTVSVPDQPPPIACIKTEYEWIREGGFLRGHDKDSRFYGEGVACSRDGGLVASGAINGMRGIIRLAPDGDSPTGPGPVAKGNPTGPGADHEHGMKPGEVSVAGGSRGLVDPMRGEGARVSIYPTSAGTVTLTVIDRKGGVVKQVSAPTSGSGVITLTWDGKNASGSPVAPGIYAVRVEGPGIRQVSKVAVVY